jgi:hypothetical protein
MWFRGDRVEILVGDDKGKQGIINYIVQVTNLSPLLDATYLYLFHSDSALLHVRIYNKHILRAKSVILNNR